MTIIEALEKMKKRKTTSEQIVKDLLAKIETENPKLNAYLEVFADVLEQAKRADERRRDGEDLPLLGIPLAIKDVILVKDKIATGASKILANYKASYDATVIKKLKEAGAVLIGKTNCDEFAMGGSNENSAFGPVRNPYDLDRVSGGSSEISGTSSATLGSSARGSSVISGCWAQP